MLTKGISQAEEEQRRKDINGLVEQLVHEGMDVKKAKAKAARDWKKDNAWYTEGNTRGKV